MFYEEFICIFAKKTMGDSFTELKIPWLPRPLNCEKIRYGIVERLTNDIEANFKDWRKDVRKLFNDLHQDMLRKMVRNTYTMIILYIIVIIETICLIFF